MLVNGLQKLTLLDYPGRTACTIFTGACNWRCPFCHNASLALHPGEQPVIDENELFSFLQKRRGLLEGVTVTGGEPTLQRDLPEFLSKLKALGYCVKLDTNGSNPVMLESVLQQGLLDYVAMDIKTSRENYPLVTGMPDCNVEAVAQSASLLMNGNIAFEFRTTVVRELHSPSDFESIGVWLEGPEPYFLQTFKDSGDLIRPGLTACSKAEMERLLQILQKRIPKAALRGVD